MDQPVDKKLILKYLNGECSPAELTVIQTFLLREDAQEIIDEVWAEEWKEFQEDEISDQEISRWRDRFLQQRLNTYSVENLEPRPLKGHEIMQSENPVKKSVKLQIWKYAAVWTAIAISIGIYFGVTKSKTSYKASTEVIAMQEIINPYGQRSTIKLPDSSVVYLGAGSKLIYPAHFAGNTREITLQGEAFFEVTKNPKKPFVISTGNVRTWVLGTSFRINAFKDKPLFVEVATGKVRVDHHDAKGKTSLAVLTPGQSLNWYHNRATLDSVNAADVKEWKNGRLVFNHATLRELTHVLERWYNVKIKFANADKEQLHMTITLTANVPMKQIMEVLASTGKFSYQSSEREIMIN